MDIVILSLGIPFNGNDFHSKSIGGSESAAYYTAIELAKLGHRVLCFTNTDQDCTTNGVQWLSAGERTQEAPFGSRFMSYATRTPHDVLIVQRAPEAFATRYASKVNLLSLHDLALVRQKASFWHGSWQIDAVVTVSEWHKNQVMETWGIEDPHKVMAIPNAVDGTLYRNGLSGHDGIESSDHFNMLYQSRPERGLGHLLRSGGIMERLAVECPRAMLYVCGYDNVTQQMAPLYRELAQRADALPNVRALGCLPKKELALLQETASLLCYPTEFEETSCITAMEAMHANLPILTSDCGAMSETCRDSGSILIPLKDGAADEDAFVQKIVELAANPSLMVDLGIRQVNAPGKREWSETGEKYDALIRAAAANASSDIGSVLTQCMRLSDVDLARHVVATYPEDVEKNAIARSVRDLELPVYSFTDSEEAYFRHYKETQDEYYESPTEYSGQMPDMSGNTRYIGVEQLVAGAILDYNTTRQLRLIDYGCAFGHFSLTLGRKFKQMAIQGVDISKAAVDEFNRLSSDAGLFPRVQAVQGTSGDAQEKADILIAAEVIEHVIDPYETLDQLRHNMLSPNGTMILTLPTGPWEHIGYRKKGNEGKRAHLRHWARAELREIFGHMDGYQELYAAAGVAPDGSPIGSFCVSFRPGDKPFGRVNFSRQLAELCPQQSVSALMIVKDGAYSLRKALDSIAPYVNEVCIGVDKTTTDNTRDILWHFAEANKYGPALRVFDIDSPLETGFDAARNYVLDRCSGQWIYWMDADEILMSAEKMPRLLREGVPCGYAMEQRHYSADPPEVLSTDLPTRLFRNLPGTRFYGVVHEHPETTFGNAIRNAIHLPNTPFICHSGYDTQETREGRFIRNAPLMARDRVAYPSRELGKGLEIRDLAQACLFEWQQTRQIFPHQIRRRDRAIELFTDLLETAKSMKTLIDSLPFYSILNDMDGSGFALNFKLGTSKVGGGVALAKEPEIAGTFHSQETALKFITKLTTEKTKVYESKYF